MIYKRYLTLAFIIIILSSIMNCTGVSNIRVNELNQNYELFAPGRKLFLTIPQKGFTLRDLRDENLRAYETSPSFYYLENRKSNLIIICWFKPQEEFTGIKSFWDDAIEGWRRAGLPSPQNVSFSKVADWDAIIYDMKYPNSTKSYIKAHWLQEGIWIEIILSIPCDFPCDEARSQLVDILQRIQVKENK